MIKPEQLKAVYHIEINRSLYEEIRIDETWGKTGIPAHSERYEEGYLWSELYGKIDTEPFDKWAYNYHMSFQGGNGTLESFFENHFSIEKIRRKGLAFLYPEDGRAISQQDYWKQDPGISWLYFKKNFDAVFPVLSEMGKIRLTLEMKGRLNDERELTFRYTTAEKGTLYVDDRHLVNICFYDERHDRRENALPLEVGRAEKTNGQISVMLYGVHSFSEFLDGLSMVADKAIFMMSRQLEEEKRYYTRSANWERILSLNGQEFRKRNY